MHVLYYLLFSLIQLVFIFDVGLVTSLRKMI